MSKIKVIKSKTNLYDDNVMDMFNGLFGQGTVDPDIVIPKYENLLSNLTKISQIFLLIFDKCSSDKFGYDYPLGISDFIKFAEKIQELCSTYTLTETTGRLSKRQREMLNQNQNNLEEYILSIPVKYDLDELKVAYDSLKDADVVKNLIISLIDLKKALSYNMNQGLHDLSNINALKDDFIIKSSGVSLVLLPEISRLDFKLVFVDPTVHAKFKLAILKMLRKFYVFADEISKIITTPDIDISKFSSNFVETIARLKKQPRLRGCAKAFDKISQSVYLLEENFNGYYKDMIKSKNPNILIESFLEDVAQKNNDNITLKSQFKTIVSFYQELAKDNIADERLDKIFNLVGIHLDALDS